MLEINGIRLIQLLNNFAQFGKTANHGVTRLALSDEDKAARDYFIQLAKNAGFTVRIDAIGNIFVRREGKNKNLLPVLVGSHSDSQPLGGRFDGIYGVLAGLESLLSFNEQQIETERTIDLVMWTNEEGARFAPAMMGAAVFTGKLSLHEALAQEDNQGVSVKAELQRIGYNGDHDFSDYKAHAALEIHIEQGPVLENHGTDIGIVTGALGQNWYQIEFIGFANHAGTTPMDMRQDASLGMAKAMLKLNELGRREVKNGGRVTVGQIKLEPNSPNVIPGKAYFTLEIRHPNAQALTKINAEIQQLLQQIATENNLTVTCQKVVTLSPIQFDNKCLSVITDITKKLGYSFENMVSGAGHDSCHLSDKMPTAMIFIPCVNGISHNEAEDIKPEWGIKGANVLANSLLELANQH